MGEVLVTGGTGVLGRRVVARLVEAGRSPIIASRKAGRGRTVEVRRIDLSDGTGLPRAMADIDTVVHLASSPFRRTRRVDVDGTRSVVAAAADAGVSHLVFMSIVGVDEIPLRYYKAKREAEAIVAAGAVPWTILRSTEFHQLLSGALHAVRWSPLLMILRGMRFQPVDVDEVAVRLVSAVAAGPGGRLADIGGPQVLDARELVTSWLLATGRRRPVLGFPSFGGVLQGFKSGANLTDEGDRGTVTWVDHLGGL